MRILFGDMFQSRAQTLINTINCVGVMGKGAALGLEGRWPWVLSEVTPLLRVPARLQVAIGDE